MKKVLFLVWLAFDVSLLQAQTVNLFNESSIGMGDSIDNVKYQVVYDAQYISETKYTKTDTITSITKEKMLLQIGNKYSAFYSYPIFQRDSVISADMAKGIPTSFSGNGGTINRKVYKNYPEQGLPGLILKAHDSENDYGFTAVGLTTIKGSAPIYYKGKTFEPIDRKSLTSI